MRREQIVDAAIAVIVEHGLPSLSLSKIEERADMSRGQLTHYFPTKEDILVAVFDRMMDTMQQRAEAAGFPAPIPNPDRAQMWMMLTRFLQVIIGRPPIHPEFNGLLYTFLSQITVRDDFRQRLASLFERWRLMMAQDMASAGIQPPPGAEGVSQRVMSSLVQAIIHGVTMQLDADMSAFERQEMLQLTLALLAPWFAGDYPPPDAPLTTRPSDE